jgi:hypothetical protein
MRINFKKFVTTSTFLIKFRYVFLSFHNEYENKGNVGFLVNFLELVHVLQATALIYFKRFYLQWSIMEHHPKNIM